MNKITAIRLAGSRLSTTITIGQHCGRFGCAISILDRDGAPVTLLSTDQDPLPFEDRAQALEAMRGVLATAVEHGKVADSDLGPEDIEPIMAALDEGDVVETAKVLATSGAAA